MKRKEFILTIYDADDNIHKSIELTSETGEEPLSQAEAIVSDCKEYDDGWDWSLMEAEFFESPETFFKEKFA